MSRLVFLAACAVAASAASFNLDCPTSNDGCGCCCYGWKLGGKAGQYTCTSEANGDVCGLCGQDGVTACSWTTETCPMPHIQVQDENGQTLPVSTRSPAPATTDGAFGAAADTTLPPTTPNAGVTLTLGTYNGMDGWLDIEPSAFYGFTGFLLGVAATVPSFYVAAGFTVKYTCEAASFGGSVPVGFVGCDIFFFVYRCPPCESLTGGVGAQLLAMDTPTWYADNCGPTFKLNRDLGVEHQFAVWQAETADGTDVLVELMAPAEFIFWAMSGKSVICSERNTEASCNAEPDNCRWIADDGVCRPSGCPPSSIYQGPSTPRCAVCVADEEQFIPEVVFSSPPPSP